VSPKCRFTWHVTCSRRVAVTVSLMPDTVDTVIWAPDDGWRYHPKHVEQFADINNTVCCWILLDNYWHILHDARTTEHNVIRVLYYYYFPSVLWVYCVMFPFAWLRQSATHVRFEVCSAVSVHVRS